MRCGQLLEKRCWQLYKTLHKYGVQDTLFKVNNMSCSLLVLVFQITSNALPTTCSIYKQCVCPILTDIIVMDSRRHVILKKQYKYKFVMLQDAAQGPGHGISDFVVCGASYHTRALHKQTRSDTISCSSHKCVFFWILLQQQSVSLL